MILEMSNMGLKLESTENNYKKVENMWNYLSDKTGAFLKMNTMDKNYIEGQSGTQLITSIVVFSACILIQSKIVVYG